MMKQTLWAGVLVVGGLVGSAGAWAHHSAAMFDATKRITVTGTVKSWEWTNPHAWLTLTVKDDKGGTVDEGFELGSPNTLIRNGFRKDSFKPGDNVTVVGTPRKDGMPGGGANQVKTASGEWLQWGPGADAKAALDAGVPSQ